VARGFGGVGGGTLTALGRVSAGLGGEGVCAEGQEGATGLEGELTRRGMREGRLISSHWCCSLRNLSLKTHKDVFTICPTQ